MFGGLFGRGQKRTAADTTRALRSAIDTAQSQAENDSGIEKKVTEEITVTMRIMKDMVFPESNLTKRASLPEDNVGEEEDHIATLVDISRNTDLLLLLAQSLPVMGFETRKEAVLVFNILLRRSFEDDGVATVFATQYGESLITHLVRGYDSSDMALNCGSMLRECVRYESLANVAVRNTVFWRFFDLVEVTDFDVASDAFASFNDILMRHVKVGASFIEDNYERFVGSYNKLLRSSNYMCRRQSLKLLSSLFFERRMFKVMMRYISCPTNLRLSMNLLLDQRMSIQYEAFQLFTIFVSNPKKSPEVKQILLRNKERLLSYLTDFQADMNRDESFEKDKQHVLEQIRKLE